MPNESGISKTVRLWLGIGTSVLLGAAGTGCSDAADKATADSGRGDPAAAQASDGSRPVAAAPGTSPGGEGEGEGASAADPVTDDVEYLHRLGQARGHLKAFMELHRQGAHDMAMTHAKHPESELYADLQPAFAARGKPGFAAELETLAETVASGGNLQAAYSNVTKGIVENEPDDADLATRLMSVATLARTAGFEFGIGVADNGTVVNAHEYQDAYGFLKVAREILAGLAPSNATQERAVELADAQLKAALGEFGSLTATQVDGDASVIHGAAARIEIEANMLR